MSKTLALFADSVNIHKGGNPEEMAAIDAIWDSVIPKPKWEPWWEVEGDPDDGYMDWL